MRTRTLLVSLIVVAASLSAFAQTPTPTPAKALNITGKWAVMLDLSIGQATPTLDLKQDGEKVTGTYTGRYGTFQLKGTLKGRALEFSFEMNAEGQTVSMSFSGEVAADGETMKGQATVEGLGDATWTAKRDKGA
jgi:hypothetical protein